MKSPSLINADTLATGCKSQKEIVPGRWVLARPLSVGGIWTRIKLAFGVFVGRYDALEWSGQ